MIHIITSSLLIMFASLVGVVTIWHKFGKFLDKNLHYLVSFSAGIFFIITYELWHESQSIGWVVIGIGISLLFFKILPEFHHHEDSHEGHRHSRIDARKILFSDTIHNLTDGILLASAFTVNTALGFTTAISIFVHEIVQEIGEFFVLRQAGYTIKKALTLNFIISSTILIGSIIGFFLLEKIEAIETPLLGITAGSFLVVIINDLLPHSLQSIHTNKHIAKHIAWFAIGLAIMFLLTFLLGHE